MRISWGPAAPLADPAGGQQSQANTTDVFPQAAAAAQPIFYDRQGNARSISGVYAEIARRFKAAGDSAETPP